MRKKIRVLLLSKLMEASRVRALLKSSRLNPQGLQFSQVLYLPEGRPVDTAQLTHRQTEVLHLMVLGFATREIARSLQISVKTVETHRKELMVRLRISRLPGLVRYALQAGILPLSWAFE